MIRFFLAALLALATTDAYAQAGCPAGVQVGCVVSLGIYNSSLPTLTNGQQGTFQFDSSGRIITNIGAGNVSIQQRALVLVTLDVAVVTTGGTAITALTATHRNAGGWVQNPSTAPANLCINEIGTASGTTSSGNTTCIVPGQTYTMAANGGAVSIISSASGHQFSGMGFQ